MVTPADFLQALYGHLEGGHLTLFSIDRNGERFTDWYPVDELAAMAERGQAMGDRNVWFGVATRREPLTGGLRGGTSDCLALPALFLDVDIAGPNHKDSTGLPADEAEALALIARFPLQPSIIVRTGGGLHPYYLLSEPAETDNAVAVLARWAETWQQIAAKYSLRLDNVFDLARVLRLPGTINQKNGGAVEIVEFRNLRYGMDDILEATVEPKERRRKSKRTGASVTGTRPGDLFNQQKTGGYVLALAGWALGRVDRNGDESWLHPWAPTSECSATVYAEDGHTTIWSETVPQRVPSIEARTPYDPYGLYVRLIHEGDFAAATEQLINEGFTQSTGNDLRTGDNGVEHPKEILHVDGQKVHLDDVTNAVITGLTRWNDPPSLFIHGEAVARLVKGELRSLNRVGLLNRVERDMLPSVQTKGGMWRPARLEERALDLALERMVEDERLPRIVGIVHSPFMRADGSICADVGYDIASHLYLTSTLPFTAMDLRTAVKTIDEMLADFPLATDADRAHVFALLLTLVVRHLVPLAPLFAFDGNGPGVGKNLIAECCVHVVTGEWAQTDPLPLDAEEQRKQITSMMAAGRSVTLFDEAHVITGTSLARLITSTTWGDRLLGYSQQVSYPNRLTMIACGNNVEVQGDLPRRTILIRLESGYSRPELRSDFRHDDLRAWVTNHRAEILGALLTILSSWHAAGRPRSDARLGSFDAWASMIGGALEHAGVKGFLTNADEMRTRGATDDDDMTAHLWELRQMFGEHGFTSKDVAYKLNSDKIETWPPRVSGDGQHLVKSLGHAYHRVLGRWFGDLRLVEAAIGHRKTRRWQVIERSSSPDQDAEVPW
jgi:hypothetical protein